MNTRKETRLEILSNGIVQVLIQTVYLKEDGSELTRENWRTTLLPGEFTKASEVLDTYHMEIIEKVWTDEVIASFGENK